MKKTYIIPEEKIVSVLAESVLAGSPDGDEGGLDGGTAGRNYDPTDATYTKGEAGWATGW